jgi:hypothetical protein
VTAARRPRIGIVGAGRRRQGLGPFVARDLIAAGAEIPGFVVTRAESRDAVIRAWSTDLGIAPRGHLELASLLGEERLDALAILSPAETHERHLEAALEAGLHVLCEKPLLWGRAESRPPRAGSRSDLTRAAPALGELPVAVQPPAFERLHPGAPPDRRAGSRCGSSQPREACRCSGFRPARSR